MRNFIIAALALLGACVSTSVGGKRTETEDEHGRKDKVDSYCMAHCANRRTEGACTEFHASAAETCKSYLHDEPEAEDPANDEVEAE